MFSQAIRWGWRQDNPAKGVERNHEEKRQRYLSAAEIATLSTALAEHEDKQAADIVRLLLLTGARKGEVLAMRWQDLDLAEGIWTKPSAHTKTKKPHRVPLSAPAKQLLSELRDAAKADAEFVFPGRYDGHRVKLDRAWVEICRSAKIASARIHDLRHTYASVLASHGLSLPIIGALLGHTQPATTARYAHLLDDPLRQATEKVGALVGGKPSATVIPFRVS
jgi:integrase